MIILQIRKDVDMQSGLRALHNFFVPDRNQTPNNQINIYVTAVRGHGPGHLR